MKSALFGDAGDSDAALDADPNLQWCQGTPVTVTRKVRVSIVSGAQVGVVTTTNNICLQIIQTCNFPYAPDTRLLSVTSNITVRPIKTCL